jgi:hypothetical protein
MLELVDKEIDMFNRLQLIQMNPNGIACIKVFF